VGRGARVTRTIIDRFNTIEPGAVIGDEVEEPPENGVLDPSGITVIARGATRVRGGTTSMPVLR